MEIVQTVEITLKIQRTANGCWKTEAMCDRVRRNAFGGRAVSLLDLLAHDLEAFVEDYSADTDLNRMFELWQSKEVKQP